MKDEIILFETKDRSITLPVQVTADTVWLNRSQLAELFGRDIKTIGKHIGNALKEELEESEVVAKFATTTPHGAIERKTQTHLTEYYNLDMIISVGYRVKSKRGVEFRRWANNVLRRYAACTPKRTISSLCRMNQRMFSLARTITDYKKWLVIK